MGNSIPSRSTCTQCYRRRKCSRWRPISNKVVWEPQNLTPDCHRRARRNRPQSCSPPCGRCTLRIGSGDIKYQWFPPSQHRVWWTQEGRTVVWGSNTPEWRPWASTDTYWSGTWRRCSRWFRSPRTQGSRWSAAKNRCLGDDIYLLTHHHPYGLFACDLLSNLWLDAVLQVI